MKRTVEKDEEKRVPGAEVSMARYPWSVKPSNPSTGMLSLKDAAGELGVAVTTVRRWCLMGQLEYVKVGKRGILVPKRAVARGGEMARMRRKVDRLLATIITLHARVDTLTSELRRVHVKHGRDCFVSGLCGVGFLSDEGTLAKGR